MKTSQENLIVIDEGSPEYLDGIEAQYRLEANGSIVAFVKNGEDARRLAACWNACEGVSTDNLEDNRAVAWLAQRYNEAVQQRDELLKAILELREANSQETKERGGPWVFHGVSRDTQRRVYAAHQALNAAILKATGE